LALTLLLSCGIQLLSLQHPDLPLWAQSLFPVDHLPLANMDEGEGKREEKREGKEEKGNGAGEL
jgi:hypothetical protein